MTTVTTASVRTVVLLGLSTFCSACSAQVMMYHHRSTVLGDHLAGYAEMLQADGLNALNHAQADSIWVRSQRELEQLRQERLAAYHYEKQWQEEQIRDKAAENRDRQQRAQQQLQRESSQLLQDVQHGRHIWPRVLQSPAISGYMLQIESILRNWDDGYPSDRRALRLAADELRLIVANADSFRFHDRVEAIRTLKRIATLAERRDMPRFDGSELHVAQH